MPLKTPRCPVCKRHMNRAGETLVGKPVHSCPRCLVIVAQGKLPVPQTPRWRDKPKTKDRPDD